MHKILCLFKDRFLSELQITDYIRQEFLNESVRKNNFSLQIICVIIFGAEFCNIARVIFLSPSGLTTRNNQIYFFLYCILIAIAALWMILRRPLKQAPSRLQLAVQYAIAILLFLWHMTINTYDLFRDPDAEITVLTTALLGLAMFIQVLPSYSLVQFGAGYLLFLIVMAPLLDTGDRLNLTITFVVALTVSLTHSRHTSIALKQQKQLLEMNSKLQELVQLDPLTELLNKTTVEYRGKQLLNGLQKNGNSSGITLFLLDLDEFKLINDRYGHPCGDHVLRETAKSIRAVFSDAAGLGRVGGDEFAILYDTPLTQDQALSLGDKLAERLLEIQWQNQPLEMRCSIGVCISPLPRYSYSYLYTETDRMLYQAKKMGRGRCCVQKMEQQENLK